MSVEDKWLAIPKDIRQKLLHNVWCGNCRTAVKMVEYELNDHEVGLLLQGICKTCGNNVARVIES